MSYLPSSELQELDSARLCREEGSNGDREMAAAMWHAGLEPWDITMSDLLQGRASLESFQGMLDPARRSLHHRSHTLHQYRQAVVMLL